MNDNQIALTPAEWKLLDRFVQYDEKQLTRATQSILSEFEKDVNDLSAIFMQRYT